MSVPKPPGGYQDEIDALKREMEELRHCMLRAMKKLEVPAAEYVPAINDAYDELQKGLYL